MLKCLGVMETDVCNYFEMNQNYEMSEKMDRYMI